MLYSAWCRIKSIFRLFQMRMKLILVPARVLRLFHFIGESFKILTLCLSRASFGNFSNGVFLFFSFSSQGDPVIRARFCAEKYRLRPFALDIAHYGRTI